MEMTIQDLAVQLAIEQLGKPYESAGQGPDKWDCSGLMIVIMQQLRRFPLGQDVTARDLYKYFRSQSRTVFKPERGNIIFWGERIETISHCALVISPEVIIGANGRNEKAVTIEHIDYRKTKYNLKEMVAIVDPFKEIN